MIIITIIFSYYIKIFFLDKELLNFNYSSICTCLKRNKLSYFYFFYTKIFNIFVAATLIKMATLGFCTAYFINVMVFHLTILQIGTICSFIYGFCVSPIRKRLQAASSYAIICSILLLLRWTNQGHFFQLISNKTLLRIHKILNIKTGTHDKYFLPTVRLDTTELQDLLKFLTKDSNLLTNWIRMMPKTVLMNALTVDQEFWMLRVCLLVSEILQKKDLCTTKFFNEFRPQVIMFFSLLKAEIIGWICGSAGYGSSMFSDSSIN